MKNKQEILVDLISLANDLDAKQHTKFANYVEALAMKVAQVEPPGEEVGEFGELVDFPETEVPTEEDMLSLMNELQNADSSDFEDDEGDTLENFAITFIEALAHGVYENIDEAMEAAQDFLKAHEELLPKDDIDDTFDDKPMGEVLEFPGKND